MTGIFSCPISGSVITAKQATDLLKTYNLITTLKNRKAMACGIEEIRIPDSRCEY
jgi:hypothetical protein